MKNGSLIGYLVSKVCSDFLYQKCLPVETTAETALETGVDTVVPVKPTDTILETLEAPPVDAIFEAAPAEALLVGPPLGCGTSAG